MTDQPPPFGAYAPGAFHGALLSITRSLPASKLGRSLASPVKNLILATRSNPVDIETFGAKTRLHPHDNLTDKRALVTPQLFDPVERAALAERFGDRFCFIDAGANTGLYSLFVAAAVGPGAKVIAIEPQPVIRERLAFNIDANGFSQISHADVALAEGPGVAHLVVRATNLGSSGLASGDGATEQIIDVPTAGLLEVMDAHGIERADALKIDIEGAEDRVLPGFFRDCPVERLPGLIIMETLSDSWQVDCVGLAKQIGYRAVGQTRRNILLSR